MPFNTRKVNFSGGRRFGIAIPDSVRPERGGIAILDPNLSHKTDGCPFNGGFLVPIDPQRLALFQGFPGNNSQFYCAAAAA